MIGVFIVALTLFGMISFILMNNSYFHEVEHKPGLKRERGAASSLALALQESLDLSPLVAAQIAKIHKSHEDIKSSLHHYNETATTHPSDHSISAHNVPRPMSSPQSRHISSTAPSLRGGGGGGVDNTIKKKTYFNNRMDIIHGMSPESFDSHTLSISTNSVLVKGAVGRTLHTVTYASHGGRDDRFCRAVESSIRSGYDLVILGWGVKWRGLSQKLEAAQSYAASLPKSDLLLFTDAFDVLFTGNKDNILKQYESMQADIVFSAECGCWPHVIENKGHACFHEYPESPTPYRYLNSGTWIGKADKASSMLLEVMKEAGSDFANANDQKLVADFYIQGRFGIKLDFYNKIFQSMHMTLDRPLPHCDPTKDVTLNEQGLYYNKLTKSVPAIFHFNGGGKRVHLSMEGKMWYKKPQYNTAQHKQDIRAQLVSVPVQGDLDRKLPFSKLCPKYLL